MTALLLMRGGTGFLSDHAAMHGGGPHHVDCAGQSTDGAPLPASQQKTARPAAGCGRPEEGVGIRQRAGAAAVPAANWSRPSLSDGVHAIAAWAGFLALAVAIVRLTVVWRREPARASKVRGLTVLAWASSVAFVLFAVALVDRTALTHAAPLGLAERIVIALNLAWLALAALSAKPRPPASGTVGRMASGIVK
ncbi:DUF998 domain-containing protein [Streptomyces nojiriensis]|uniref:DUF998 domain-containing protein n=1 Tax=Streptomyces nojiriensis TaxID=66374 RepID=UPI00365569B8